MLIYGFLAASALLAGLLLDSRRGSNTQKMLCFFFFAALVFFAALRAESVGRDTYQFCLAFQVALDPSYHPGYTRKLEPGFVLLCETIGLFSDSSQMLIAVTSLVSLGAVGMFVYRESNNVALSVFAFITLNLYAFFMNGMRQAVAMGFFLLFFEVSRRSERKAFAWLGVLVAASFHLSALVLAVVLLSGCIRKTWWKIFFLGSVVLAVFPRAALWLLSLTPYGIYGTESYLSEFIGSNYFGALLQALLAVYLFWITKCLVSSAEGDKLAVRHVLSKEFLQTMAMLSAVLAIASMGVSLFSRVQVYFLFFAILAVPRIVSSARESRGGVTVGNVVLLGSLSGFWLITTLFRPEWYEVVPYHFFF